MNQEKSPQSVISQFSAETRCFECAGLSGSERAYFVSELYSEHRIPILCIVSSPKQGETFFNDLRFFLRLPDEDQEQPSDPVIWFPPYNILPFKQLSYHNETAAKRIRTLYRIISDKIPRIVIAPVSVLLQKLVPKRKISDYAELLMVGEDIQPDILVSKLIAGGYSRSVIVEEPGDFSVRGGIIDIFCPLYPEPLRIELFGDTVDSLRFFSAASQRTLSMIQEAVILPAREVILNAEDVKPLILRIREQGYAQELPAEKIREMADRISDQGTFPGIESLVSLIYPKPDTLFDYLPDNTLFVLMEPGELESAAETWQQQIAENYMTARGEGRLCVEPKSLYMDWAETKSVLEQKQTLTIKSLPPFRVSDKTPDSIFNSQSSILNFSVESNADIRDELKNIGDKEQPFLPLAKWITDKIISQYAVIAVCSTRSQSERLKSLLENYDIGVEVRGSGSEVRGQRFPRTPHPAPRTSVFAYTGQLSSGFVWQAASLAVITEAEIFGEKGRKRKLPARKVHTELLTFEELKQGDLVVHTEHGIGRYEGLVKLELNGTVADFLLIVYKDDDRLYVPVDRMGMVQKYMGVEGFEPVLDKMGGKSWDRVKSKVKKSVEKMAGELLNLYAARKVRDGHAYGQPDASFREFEAGFPYEETPDQFRAIEDVLADMQSSEPMDRLVCGDVGYGKTEVALRASLLAVNDGKQVAVLVPTTVLAEQHFAAFSSRFEQHPVVIRCLNRFRSLKEQREIIGDLKKGSADIVIGTHRLLQKDIDFKDLGLVILDEEQRFGVRHKEKLKKIRNTVDVLALTATPIPRTLHLSLMGIRDISIISTPPEHRRAIITYISEFDEAVISEAVRKELARKGQIFFVHNNTHTIGAMAERLRELIPEVRLGIAHGRMEEDELEKVMFRFMNHEIDMLVCTTIIESGIDIPSANTILINHADRFGLAQIYQLRGRVGRADEQAYAYLFIPNESALSRDARKRLKVLMEHSDLGAGFQIAMSDLKIRGGGTVLGASQSGHIAAVGYDMFLKLMEHAISELKGEPAADALEPEINVNMSAFIPESYISDIDQRLSAYRRLTKMNDLKEISEYKAELIDRFGPLPPEAANLLLKIMLRVLSIKAGVKKLDLSDHQAIFCFSEAHQKNPSAMADMILADPQHFEFTPDQVLKFRLEKRGGGSPLVQAKNLLKEIAQCVN
ncbi:MAG: transcription-repair coupling factor, partial [Desulfobacteraceae bacterium IS3]